MIYWGDPVFFWMPHKFKSKIPCIVLIVIVSTFSFFSKKDFRWRKDYRVKKKKNTSNPFITSTNVFHCLTASWFDLEFSSRVSSGSSHFWCTPSPREGLASNPVVPVPDDWNCEAFSAQRTGKLQTENRKQSSFIKVLIFHMCIGK